MPQTYLFMCNSGGTFSKPQSDCKCVTPPPAGVNTDGSEFWLAGWVTGALPGAAGAGVGWGSRGRGMQLLWDTPPPPPPPAGPPRGGGGGAGGGGGGGGTRGRGMQLMWDTPPPPRHGSGTCRAAVWQRWAQAACQPGGSLARALLTCRGCCNPPPCLPLCVQRNHSGRVPDGAVAGHGALPGQHLAV
jgi:hypothetical protein